MSSDRNHYEVLGVDPEATSEEIRHAYREQARLLHPDVTGSSDRTAGEEMASVNEAWRVLSDAGSRSAYDRGLRRAARAPDAGRDVVPAQRHKDGGDGEPIDLSGPLFTTDSRLLAVVARGWPILLLLAVLAIFVFTAYATGDGESPDPTGTGPGGTEVAWQVGDCLDRLPEATAVPCSGPHDAVVEAVVSDDDGCAGTAGWFEADVAGPNRLCIVYQR